MRGRQLLTLLAVVVLSAPQGACSDDDNDNNNQSFCGNGVVETGEECDGVDLAGQTCVSVGLEGGTLACTVACVYDLTGCVGCGSGVIDLGEVCDGTDLDGVTCQDLGFIGGTLGCAADCTDYDVSACEESPTVCLSDEAVALDHWDVIVRHFDSSIEDHTVDVACEEGTGNTPDRIVALSLSTAGDLVVYDPSAWVVASLFAEPSDPADCFTGDQEVACLDPTQLGSWLVWSDIPAGNYYLVISDWTASTPSTIDFHVGFYPTGAEICNNNVDDDGDNRIDCADSECQASSPYCNVEYCSNGVDDNLDGFTDCLDMTCVGSTSCTGGTCVPDTDLRTVHSGQYYSASFDTSTEADDYNLPCGSSGQGEHVVQFSLDATGLVRIRVDQANAGENVVGFFFEGPAGYTCVDQPYFCIEPTSETVMGMLATEPLPAGNYFVIVEAAAGGGPVDLLFEVLCPPGQHDNGGYCEWDTCADLDCESLHMGCTDIPTPSVCQGCLAGYVPAYGRCVVDQLTYGDACQTDSDCPGTGTPGITIQCLADGTGGYCRSINTPECPVGGQPCTDDLDSVCVVSGATGNHYCYMGCTQTTDCRSGYQCWPNLFSSGVSACVPMSACDVNGCNDPTGTLYCDPSSLNCWFDACNPTNPCTEEANSSGVCQNVRDDYSCECDATYAWNATAQECELFVCGATDLGVWSGTPIQQQADTCLGANAFSPAGGGGCTGWDALGNELLFRLVVPVGQTITVTETPLYFNDMDSSLYLITDCEDYSATTCLTGADNTYQSGVESLTWTNNTSSDVTVYIVTDAYAEPGYTLCGEIQLDIQ